MKLLHKLFLSNEIIGHIFFIKRNYRTNVFDNRTNYFAVQQSLFDSDWPSTSTSSLRNASLEVMFNTSDLGGPMLLYVNDTGLVC